MPTLLVRTNVTDRLNGAKMLMLFKCTLSGGGRDDGKQPWYFTPAKEPIALIAANKEDIVRSSTMVITEPNQFVAQYHDRMPVVLDRTNVLDWLTGAKGLELLKPAPEDVLEAWPVSRRVNSSKAPDEPTLIEPIDLSAK